MPWRRCKSRDFACGTPHAPATVPEGLKPEKSRENTGGTAWEPLHPPAARPPRDASKVLSAEAFEIAIFAETTAGGQSRSPARKQLTLNVRPSHHSKARVNKCKCFSMHKARNARQRDDEASSRQTWNH